MVVKGAAKKIFKRRCIKRPWGQSEDDQLIELVKSYGVGNWNCIATHFTKRTGQSCRLRWYNQLDPKLVKSPFTEKEQNKLLELHKKHGNKWSTIARSFPGRTDNQLKNQYHVLVGTRYNKASSPPSSSTVTTSAVGSKFSNNSSFAPDLAGGIDTPRFSYDPASVYGQLGANFGECMMSDESWPAAEPMQGAYSGDYQFIDFLGVGNI